MAKNRRRFSEWTSTGKSWPLTSTIMAIIVSMSYIFMIVPRTQILWMSTLVGIPLLCFAMTGLIYKLLFPAFKRNLVTNLLVHLIWTSAVAVATSFIVMQQICWEVVLAIVPTGLIAAGITHGKNRIAAYAYGVEIMATYLYVTVLSFLEIFPMTTVIIYLTVPIAFGCTKTMINSIEGGAHLTKDMGARTANLLHLFTGLLALAFVADKLIK